MWIFLLFICVGTIAIFALPYILIAQTELPQPSGRWQVGTQDLTWDTPDSLSERLRQRSHTNIIAKVWYPTNDRSGKNSHYIDRIGRVFSDVTAINLSYKLIFWLLQRVTTSPASIDAMPIDLPDGLPIILFSPGFGGINYLGTFYALEFASHGFIVIGINHPKFNVGTMCTDGSQIKFENLDPAIFNEPDKLEQYIGKVTQAQAQNISAIVDKVIQLDSVPDSLFYRRINTSKIFAAGHSAGGAASFVACGQDRRILKAVDLDGAFVDLGIENADYTGKKLLSVNADREKYKPKHKKSLRQYDAIIAIDKLWMDKLAARANLQQQIIESTTHYSFTDLSILINPAIGQKIGLLGRSDGLSILAETSKLMIDFFNSDYLQN
jgi:Platelet-activating factor acetylhydrolase, isoform II